jgi:eukaryotic-like serine/threonine-protein kinase
MTPQEYDHLREIFLEAREKHGADRAEFLRRACDGNELLRHEVDSLLANDERVSAFLDSPAMGDTFALREPVPLVSRIPAGELDVRASQSSAIPPTQPMHPQRIGQYRLSRVIGEGGMGVVYQAEQENPRRTVALKVIRPGIESQETLRRFQYEGQILAWLQHPGIAQIHEAGTADTGLGPQPFFAMEYIEGQGLTKYAEEHRLGIRERLELMTKVCDAVHHAHQKGVIHRDLKPGNILVNASGQPKILDFGVARATDSDIKATTIQTAVGQLVGTIAYMSPEQVAGDPRELDTRADVYALGVICYELLTGRVPIDVTRKTLPQAARAIMEEEPTSLRSLNKVFDSDVEAIVAKAMEKSKTQRYQSASDLAEDVRRYLQSQPVSARPITTLYQLRKFASRNKPMVGVGAAAFFALLIGIAGTTSQAIRATREKNRAQEAELIAEQKQHEAERQAAIAQAVNEFLNHGLLAAASPAQETDRNVTVRQILDRAAKSIEGQFKDETLVEAAIRTTLGDAYSALGLYQAASTHLEKALALRREALGEDALDTLMTMNHLGVLYTSQSRYDEAETMLVKTVEGRRRLRGEDHVQTVASMNNLATLYARQGRHKEEEALSLQVLERSRRIDGEESGSALIAMGNLAELYAARGRYEEAEKMFLGALDGYTRSKGQDHPSTLTNMSNLAKMYGQQGRYQEAESLCTRALEARRRVLGEDHPQTLTTMEALAVLYWRQERFEEAEPLFLNVLAAKERVLGKEHPNTLVTMNNLAILYTKQGLREKAEELHLRTLEIRRRVLGEQHPQTVTSMGNLAEIYKGAGRYQEAEPLYWKALAQRRAFLGETHEDTCGLLRGLAYTLMKLDRFEEAEALALDSHQHLSDVLGAEHDRARQAAELLVELYNLWERPDRAAAWKARTASSQPAGLPSDGPSETEENAAEESTSGLREDD